MAAIRTTALLLLVFAGGCASEPAYQILTPFHDDDFTRWTEPGPYTISGSAAYKRADGETVSCAGQDVLLLPLTSYSMELSKLLETGKGFPPNYERRAHKYEHKAVCNGDGKFSFSGLATANWLVATHIGWQEDSTLSSIPWVGGPTTAGGWLFREITVHDADVHVMLSAPDFTADKN